MCGLTDPMGCVESAARSGLEAFAKAMADGAAWIVTESFTWWMTDERDASLNTGVAEAIREVTMPLTVSIAAAGMIWLGIQMVLTGRADPLLTLGEGIGQLVFWTVSGMVAIGALYQGAAAFSGWVLDSARSTELGDALLGAFSQGEIDNIGAVLLLSLIGFLAGVVQWIIGMMREAALVILAGVLPLAAAGRLGLGRGWIQKIGAWSLALIFWQPAAALVYFAAFSMIENAESGQDTLVGVAMLVIAIAALPALMKLFTWIASGDANSGEGGRGGTGMGRDLAARRGGRRMSPGQHAQMLDSGLPRQGGSGTTGGKTSGGGAKGGPEGATSAPKSSARWNHTSSPAPLYISRKKGDSSAGEQVPTPGMAKVPAGAGAGAGTAASGVGTGTGAGAAGAKAAGVAGGPVGAAAAATAAGAKAAGKTMTEGADNSENTKEKGRDR